MKTQNPGSPARRILVADDNLVILKTLSLALKDEGYEVITVLDGSEAVSVVRQNKPDLILLDIFFPPNVTQVGMVWDGFNIIEWLRRMGEQQDIPIIIISGAEPAKYAERCLAAGAIAFFHKPLDIPGLLAAIRKALGSEPAGRLPGAAANFEV